MALPAFMKKAFSRDGGNEGHGTKGDPRGPAGRLAKLAASKNDNDGDEGGTASIGKGGKKPKFFGKKKGGAMQAAALRLGD